MGLWDFLGKVFFKYYCGRLVWSNAFNGLEIFLFMAVILKADPSVSFANRQDFLNRVEPYSIAVDGIIREERTFRVPEGPYGNFDHHYGEGSGEARSSFMQLSIEIVQGRFIERFSRNGETLIKMYADHGDEDVCGCYWALSNAEKIIKNNNNGGIWEFIDLCDKLDTTAGSFSGGDAALRRKINWMFKPYHDARYNDRPNGIDANGLCDIIREVEGRINEYVEGGGGEVELEGKYDVIDIDNERNKRNGWTFVKEYNAASRKKMYSDGIGNFVSLVGTREGGRNTFSVIKKTDWDPYFCLPDIFRRCNEAEGSIIPKCNYWGGSLKNGGSPKMTGSGLNFRKLEDTINESIEYMRRKH